MSLNKKNNAVVVALIFILPLFLSCSAAFKKATEKWSSAHTKNYVKYIQADSRYSDDQDRASEFMNVAGLACLIDEDKGLSKPESKSPACKCAQAVSAEGRTADCKTWSDSLK